MVELFSPSYVLGFDHFWWVWGNQTRCDFIVDDRGISITQRQSQPENINMIVYQTANFTPANRHASSVNINH